MWWEIPGHLEVVGNELYIGGLKASELAKKYGTPLYVYNADRIIENYRRIKNALEKHADREVRIYYSVKANSNISILKLLREEGCWADAVSPWEVKLCLDAGFPKEKILFTGTSVSNEDLMELVESKITINIDSFSQMIRLAKMVRDYPISIRWNPGEGAGQHSHTITAGKYVKFGIPENKIVNAYEKAIELGLNPIGFHQHIGSGWLGRDVDVFLRTVDKTLKMAEKIEKVLGKGLEFVDFGGGPGIPYKENDEEFPIERYAKGICEKVARSGVKAETIAVEPGRYIVGDAGILLLEVNTVEEKGIPIIGVDGGFNVLLRPAFYSAYHEIVICNKAGERGEKEYLVAGNLCESGDVFNETKTRLRRLPEPKEGDYIAILNAGAYGFVMASRYNSRPLPAEVMILNGRDRLIRERERYEDLKRHQIN